MISIGNLLSRETICLDLPGSDKAAAIEHLAGLLESAGKLESRPEYLKAVWNREAQMSTGIGMGIAIPHGKSRAVRSPAVALGRSDRGIDFQSLDDGLVHLVLLLAVPEAAASDEHLRILASLARMLMDEDFRRALLEARTGEEILEVISRAGG